MSTGSAERFRELPLGTLRDLAEMIATVAAAARAGIFHALLDGSATPGELARSRDLDPRAVAIVLPALGDLGLVEDRDGRYGLTDRGRRELADPSCPDYAARGLPHWLHGLRAWARLDEVLREGGPVDAHGTGEGEEGDDRIARFMEAMAAAPDERVKRLVRATLRRHPAPRTVLDLGGGPGHIARAFADEGLEVTLLDTPETIAWVRDAYGLDEAERIHPVGADFLKDALPEGPFDVVLLSNVTHIYPPEENGRLLGKVAGVTEAGSVVAIQDFVRGRSPRAARFALLMLMKTEGGDTYTESEYRQWLRDAGFVDVDVEDLDRDRQLVTALRGGAEGRTG